jgi:hypothetical protein
MATRIWIPAAAAAGVVVVIGAGVLLTRSGSDPSRAAAVPPAAAAPPPAARLDDLRGHDGDLVTASGTVLAAPGRPVRFCAPSGGGLPATIGPERPPGCSPAVTLAGADVSRLTEPNSYREVRWGRAAITGRYAHGTITVTAQGTPRRDPNPPDTLPVTPPCPAPAGGWQPGPLSESGRAALTAAVGGHPAQYGEVVVTYPDGPPSGPTAAPGYAGTTQVVLVTTTLDPAEAEKELRRTYDGNLCVRPAVRSRAATDAVWRKLSPENGAGAVWTRYGVYAGGPDHLTGRVRIDLTVLDDAAYRWLAGGGEVVEARPWLRPAG